VRVPPLHLVTDDRTLADPDFVPRAVAAMEAGADRVALHLRGPGTAVRRLFDLAQVLRPEAGRAGALLLVNDRVDVALAAGADGVQLGRRAMAVADARSLLGAERLIGASVHAAGEVDALAGPPDFLLVGTLFPTASHPGRVGSGPDLLRDLARFGFAMIGIGGIGPPRVRDVRAAGAAGVAVLRGIWGAPDPAHAVKEYLEQWQLFQA
jgi:thiamine-phosphate diphosphorylase